MNRLRDVEEVIKERREFTTNLVKLLSGVPLLLWHAALRRLSTASH